ncbi:ParB family chromosome partitioning protein [Caldicellulosiruptor bescii]|uniref:ParB-like partition protein n=2 Tax=Caldicellulosiruptor bescii TaxID=31899 RepID=B9MQF0_CALBD|nr:ParB/RepB/Spo0J family partition protein [Caldicellulosiruptor bescii]ACM61807.1 parB-like partition protein [Caldicellulosiruptor bescii DSM 6725]PBC88394.1 ParB family chromosome partitioning protein [Caldicellulosiruptor bescii]PBC92125.1 ParB family chromosome partitioning protein [Caldicellulosiruptor bescii]PBD05065.1 ParB family chromosome partitioning protein [Caldicellulosiruptor bescii]PBD05304.1 ParB family chromosome partitioning protein [Caldicellulosiruptor bescii]
MFSLLIRQTNKGDIEKEIYYIEDVPIEKILPNPYQPRVNFDERLIEELAVSIKTYGLLQPIIVRKKGEYYYLIAGERRLRACKHLGYSKIKAVVINVTDIESAILALIENIQRQDLDFFEEAQGYKQLSDEFGLTQVEIAKRVGKTQSAIANKIRLLQLPADIRWVIREHGLSERHARALLKLESQEDMKYILSRIIEGNLTVSQTERLISDFLSGKKIAKTSRVIKISMNDCRVVYNTIKKALKIFQKTDINYDIKENKTDAYYEIIVRINKKSPQTSS